MQSKEIKAYIKKNMAMMLFHTKKYQKVSIRAFVIYIYHCLKDRKIYFNFSENIYKSDNY